MALVKAHHILYSKPHKSSPRTRLFLIKFTYTPIYVKFFQVVTSSVYFRQDILFMISHIHATYLVHLLVPYFTIIEISADWYKL